MRRAGALCLITAACALLVAVWARAQPTVSPEVIKPNPAIQGAIAGVAAASDDATLQASLARLRQLGGPDFADLVPQLVYYLMNAQDAREAMVPGIIIDRLSISPAQVRQALAPYRASSDVRVRQQIENLLGNAAAP